MKLWDARTGEELMTLKGHTVWVAIVSFSPDGAVVISGDSSGHRIRWDDEHGVVDPITIRIRIVREMLKRPRPAVTASKRGDILRWTWGKLHTHLFDTKAAPMTHKEVGETDE